MGHCGTQVQTQVQTQVRLDAGYLGAGRLPRPGLPHPRSPPGVGQAQAQPAGLQGHMAREALHGTREEQTGEISETIGRSGDPVVVSHVSSQTGRTSLCMLFKMHHTP